jgi:chaperonin GroES
VLNDSGSRLGGLVPAGLFAQIHHWRLEMNIRPLHDRVVIKRMEEERKSPGGIVLPDSATEKPVQGEVLAVGPGKVLDNGEVRHLQVKVGDRVLFGKYSGTEVKLGDQEVLVMREDDLMGVVEN